MTIAVNTRFLFADNTVDGDNFIFECFSRLAEKYPQHQFIYIFEEAFDKKYITAENITGVIARSPLLWQYWYNYKVPALLKKYKDNYRRLSLHNSFYLLELPLLFISDISALSWTKFIIIKCHQPPY